MVSKSLLGSSVHGISQAKILEEVAIYFSRGSSQPRDWTHMCCLAGRFFTIEPPGKKRWQEYTELYKKDLQDPDNHNGVNTHLKPDILECKVKWALGSITISNPKRWCCESAALNMSAKLENSAVATGLEKVSFHSNPKARQCQRVLKLPHNCTHLTH